MKTPADVVVKSTVTNYKTIIYAGQHQLHADEPQKMGGQDSAPAPYDYILAGLGSCTTITLKMYADRKGWSLGEITLALNFSRDADGNAHVDRLLRVSNTIDEHQWERLLDIASKTPVTKTLMAGMSITTRRAEDI